MKEEDCPAHSRNVPKIQISFTKECQLFVTSGSSPTLQQCAGLPPSYMLLNKKIALAAGQMQFEDTWGSDNVGRHLSWILTFYTCNN